MRVTCAYVAGAGLCACHRGEKLIFSNVEINFNTLEFYRECQPIKLECYLCIRSQRGTLRVSQGRTFIFSNVEIDFYHLGVYRECKPIK